MLQSSAKAFSLIRDLKDLLNFRLNPNASGLNFIRQAVDELGWPYLVFSNAGTETEGSSVFFLRIRGIDAVSKDIFGGSLYSYAPHNMDIAYELTSGGKPIPSSKDMLAINFEAIKLGVAMNLIEVANGTAVTLTSVEAALAAGAVESLDIELWPLKGV